MMVTWNRVWLVYSGWTKGAQMLVGRRATSNDHVVITLPESSLLALQRTPGDISVNDSLQHPELTLQAAGHILLHRPCSLKGAQRWGVS